jgi:hypothetical protein
MKIKDALRRWLWGFALKHCKPLSLSPDAPNLVFVCSGHAWKFTEINGQGYIVFNAGLEAIPLNPFLLSALNFLNQHSHLVSPTVYERLGDRVRKRAEAMRVKSG